MTLGKVTLPAALTVPDGSGSVVLFAHGSGSSRHSPRNARVATVLNDAGHATLLFDLLVAGEDADRANVFDIRLLASRLVDTTRWLRDQPGLGDKRIGYFGASTGAAAALVAAAKLGDRIGAVVSRGGRPDLAGDKHLAALVSPVLLIVGGLDKQVMELNREAAARLRAPHELAVVLGAGHLFEEPGTLDEVALRAVRWFDSHLQ